MTTIAIFGLLFLAALAVLGGFTTPAADRTPLLRWGLADLADAARRGAAATYAFGRLRGSQLEALAGR